MEKLGLSFQVIPSSYIENMDSNKKPEKLACELALGKARAISKNYRNAVIIGADTFIVLGDKKIGKPKDISEAEKIIRAMSGSTLEVITGVAVLKTAKTGKIIRKFIFSDTTFVKIKPIPEQKIHFLARHPEALEIAGALSIEGTGKGIVETVEGDIDTVIGLPIAKLKKIIQGL